MEIIIIIFRPTSTKPQAEILKLNNVNGCNDISLVIIVFWKETALLLHYYLFYLLSSVDVASIVVEFD